jgi:hypothetical protein
MMMVVVIYVHLIEFGTVVIFSGYVSVKSLLITEPSRATALFPVRLANDSFEDKIILFLLLDGVLEIPNR